MRHMSGDRGLRSIDLVVLVLILLGVLLVIVRQSLLVFYLLRQFTIHVHAEAHEILVALFERFDLGFFRIAQVEREQDRPK
jgi:hypothetical protein